MDRYRGDPSVANRVDDSLGYADGDQLSIEVARRLTRVVAEQLPESRHIVARLGGDEFGIIILPAGEALARGAAETLLAEIEKPFLLEGRETITTATIGVATMHGGYESVQDLVRDADTAMYRAKANGKARYEVFDATMRAAVVARAQLSQELSAAVRNADFP